MELHTFYFQIEIYVWFDQKGRQEKFLCSWKQMTKEKGCNSAARLRPGLLSDGIAIAFLLPHPLARLRASIAAAARRCRQRPVILGVMV